MKVSEAIELALETYYMDGDLKHTFMCLTLRTMCQQGLIPNDDYVSARLAVKTLVRGIMPDSVALGQALQYAGVTTSSIEFKEECDIFKQLYIWWVFDLKRKGL